jgi:hypothetical protein
MAHDHRALLAAISRTLDEHTTSLSEARAHAEDLATSELLERRAREEAERVVSLAAAVREGVDVFRADIGSLRVQVESLDGRLGFMQATQVPKSDVDALRAELDRRLSASDAGQRQLGWWVVGSSGATAAVLAVVVFVLLRMLGAV